MRKILFIFFVFITIITINAQIKVMDGGRVGIGTNTVGTNDKVHIKTTGMTRGLLIDTDMPYGWWQSATVNVTDINTVSWVVNRLGINKFFVHGSGYIYANGSYYSSDLKFKQDIESIENPISKIMALRGVTYLMKEEVQEYKKASKEDPSLQEPKRHLGFIADEVQEVIPEVIKTLPDGTKALAYHQLTALNVEVLKEHQKEIRTLKSEIKSLKDKLEKVSDGKNQSTDGDNENLERFNVLYQNKPNPFDNETIISFKIIEKNFLNASILIFDMNGTLLKEYPISKNNSQGQQIIQRNEFSPGMYLYSLIVNDSEIDTKKMILSK